MYADGMYADGMYVDGMYADDPVDRQVSAPLEGRLGSIRLQSEDSIDDDVVSVSSKQVLQGLHRVVLVAFSHQRERLSGITHQFLLVGP